MVISCGVFLKIFARTSISLTPFLVTALTNLAFGNKDANLSHTKGNAKKHTTNKISPKTIKSVFSLVAPRISATTPAGKPILVSKEIKKTIFFVRIIFFIVLLYTAQKFFAIKKVNLNVAIIYENSLKTA